MTKPYCTCQECGKQYKSNRGKRVTKYCSSDCYDSYRKKNTDPRMIPQDEFLKRCIAKHGDRYGYSKVVYSGLTKKIVITCSKHGDFNQHANNHARGQGCPKCRKNRRIDTKEFIRRARGVHGERYSYRGLNYINTKTKVLITCFEHGSFKQFPQDHLKGFGCDVCSGNAQITTEEFIRRSKLAHGSYYDYSRSVYTNARSKVVIICPEHGEFLQSAASHARGTMCKQCSFELQGWGRSDYISICNKKYGGKSSLYVIRCTKNNEVFYKIGISVKSINERFSEKKMPYNTELVKSISAEVGFIWDLESKLHRINKHNKYKPLMSFDGDTECFIKIPKGIYELIDRLSDTAQLPLIA